MLANEFLFRCVMYPRGIDNNVLAEEYIFRISESKEKPKVYETSIASSTLCGDEAGRHRYGDRTAVAANDFSREQGRLTDESECHYICHYEFSFGAAYGLTCPYYTLCIYSSPENGLDEHFALELRPNGKAADKKALRQDRTSLLRDLVKICIGPYVKPGLAEHLAQIELPTLGAA